MQGVEMLKKRGPFMLSCLVLLLVLVGLDQWTKAAISRFIPFGDTVVMIPGFFELTNLRNTGMAFSMLDSAGMGFFVPLTLAVICVIVWYFFHTKDMTIQLSLVLICAGAVGNLIDRMMQGYVTDFFQFYIFGKPFAVFNIADVCITLGFVFLLIGMLMEEHREKQMKALLPKDHAETAGKPKDGAEQ